MLLLLFACSGGSEDPGRPPEATEDAHAPADSYARTPDFADQSTGEQHPACSHRTDHREGTGSGTIILTLEMPEGMVYTIRPVPSFSVQDTSTIPNTQVLGYDPAVGAEFLAGEQGVIYWCDVDYWHYRGDLDVTKAMDSHGRTTYKVSQRYYNEDDTLRETRQVDFQFSVREVVFRQ